MYRRSVTKRSRLRNDRNHGKWCMRWVRREDFYPSMWRVACANVFEFREEFEVPQKIGRTLLSKPSMRWWGD